MEKDLRLGLLAYILERLESIVVYASVFSLKLLFAELPIFLVCLKVLRTEIGDVINFTVPNIIALCLV